MKEKISKVTVLMPVYNGEKYLDEAIQSVLEQTFVDFEFLIINDGSTDKSLECISKYRDRRIRLVQNDRNLGLSATLNRGLELASGEYIARMDQDDICYPGRLLKQVAFMDTHAEVGVCGTWVKAFGEIRSCVWKYPSQHEVIYSRLLFDSPIAHPTVMLRKEMLQKYHLAYNPAHVNAEDWGLWKECAKHIKLANLPSVELRYRVTAGSMSRGNAEEHMRMIKGMDEISLRELLDDVDQEQIELHRQVGSCHMPLDMTKIHLVERWLINLGEANRKRKIYPQPYFNEVLSDKWYQVCSSNAYRNGISIWRIYRASMLNENVCRHLAESFSLYVRCALGTLRGSFLA